MKRYLLFSVSEKHVCCTVFIAFLTLLLFMWNVSLNFQPGNFQSVVFIKSQCFYKCDGIFDFLYCKLFGVWQKNYRDSDSCRIKKKRTHFLNRNADLYESNNFSVYKCPGLRKFISQQLPEIHFLGFRLFWNKVAKLAC